MKSVKYLQDSSKLQLTFTEKTEIKNLGCATPDLVTCPFHQAEKDSYM
jgi:hypothetical protein